MTQEEIAQLYAGAMGDTTGSTGFDLGGLLGNIFSTDGLGTAISGLSNLYSLQEKTAGAEGLGQDVLATVQNLATQAGQEAAFQPYALTSTPGLGGVSLTESGAQLQGTPQLEQLTTSALGGAQDVLSGLLAPRATREQQIYNALQEARAPSLERQRQELEQRLFAQGRGDVQTAMYGATPEELARQKAIVEQQSQDYLSAMTQAGTEQTQQQALLSSLLGTAYTPQSQAISLLQAGIDPAKLAQSGRLSASEALQAAMVPVAQAETAGRKLALDYTTPMVQAYTGLLGPAIQTAGQAIDAEGIASKIGTAVQGGVSDLYDKIFG